MANNCAQCSKLLIILINISIMICGLSLLILGALFLVDLKATQVLNISTLDTSSRVVHSTAVAMVGIGVGVLIISLLGCVAAMKESRSLLTAYCGFNIFIMFLELILCIMVVASIDDILNEVENTMNITVQTQYGQPGYELETDAWDTLQTQLHCCGSNSTKDWQTSLWIRNETYRVVPDSCCVPQSDVTNGTANTTECQEAVKASQYNSSAVYWTGCEARTIVWVHDHKTTLLSITFFATLFQFAVVIFSLCMCRNVRNRYDHFA